jgi:hypothetical protein
VDLQNAVRFITNHLAETAEGLSDLLARFAPREADLFETVTP